MEEQKQDKIGRILYGVYWAVLALAVAIVFRVLFLQIFWKPNPRIEKLLSQPVEKEIIEPVRGCILAQDGRPLAMSYPRYQVFIDCCVRQKEFRKLDSGARADSIAAWHRKASELAKGLAATFNIEGKTAESYEKTLFDAFENGRRYLKLGRPIERGEYLALKEYPLFNEGRKKGGVWVEPVPTRRYPYGKLAMRTIGSVTQNADTTYMSGIEGKFNHELHGYEGKYFLKKTDNGYVRDYDSVYVKAINGNDVRTTINIDYQDIADKTLRDIFIPEKDVEAACCVLMEVKTGAIRAMVNLERAPKGDEMGEIDNVAILRRGEPGSVFKLTTLMTCIEDGIVTDIDQEIPSNGGFLQGYKFEKDKHITDYEKKYHKKTVPIRYGVQVSSNYVFRYLALTHYKDKPEEFLDRLYMYKLGEAFDFDVYEKMTTPRIPDPKSKYWSIYDLGQAAMGYAVSVTPLHVLTFYNAIAGKGKMMKPYLVEDIEKDGKVIRKLGPSVLNASICKPTTADMLTDALTSVTSEKGTAAVLSKAKCTIAGKTGTSQIAVNGKYTLAGNKHKYQATFVGFFPAEDPQYTIICTAFTKETAREFFGGVLPAQAVMKIVNKVYTIDPYWNEAV